MQDKLGESFDGTISGVTSFGIFVALDNVYVEGLVHITELGNDYFHLEPTKHLLVGERTGQRYRLGDRVRVKVARVDLERARTDFVMDEEEASIPSSGPFAGSKRKTKRKTSGS